MDLLKSLSSRESPSALQPGAGPSFPLDLPDPAFAHADVIVTDWSEGRIPWPRFRQPGEHVRGCWVVGRYVDYDHNVRLHSAIGYITPKDKLEGREKAIFAERDRKLAEARERRKANRQAVRATPGLEAATTLT